MFAIFRASPDKDLAQIGESHLQRDLSQEDRDVLSKAARKVSVHATMGSLLGLGLGILAAYRIHANRVALYNAFRMVSKPSEIVFADGRRGMLFPFFFLFFYPPFFPPLLFFLRRVISPGVCYGVLRVMEWVFFFVLFEGGLMGMK